MKHSIFIFLLFLLGCNNNVTSPKNETQAPISEYPKVIYIGDPYNNRPKKNFVTLGSDGHEYLTNCDLCSWKYLIHYPDCKYCLKRDSLSTKI